jgi:hypothetical protein
MNYRKGVRGAEEGGPRNQRALTLVIVTTCGLLGGIR